MSEFAAEITNPERRRARNLRHRALAQVVAWSILAGCLWWLVQRGVASPGWFLVPLLVLLITCLLGIVTGLLQATFVLGTLLVTAYLETTGKLSPVADAGIWLRAVVAAGAVLGTALCGVLVHRTLHTALRAEEAQNERLDTTLKALRRRERLLRHVLRVETVSEVSSMVVHQLRNQFQMIMGHAAAGVQEGDLHTEPHFRAIVDTLGSSNGLMESLLGLARNHPERVRRVDLGDVCEAVGERFGALLPETCVLQLSRTERPLPVLLDTQGLEHALLNLVINARQAMDSQGTITLEVLPTAKGTATVRVRDTGPGIERRHLDEVFKPFFTTKPAGQGTGLGLAAVQRFVLSSNGDVAVESQPGQGACFSLCFPLAATDAGENTGAVGAQQATG